MFLDSIIGSFWEVTPFTDFSLELFSVNPLPDLGAISKALPNLVLAQSVSVFNSAYHYFKFQLFVITLDFCFELQ